MPRGTRSWQQFHNCAIFYFALFRMLLAAANHLLRRYKSKSSIARTGWRATLERAMNPPSFSPSSGEEDADDVKGLEDPAYLELTRVCASYDEYECLVLEKPEDLQPFIEDRVSVVIIQDGVAVWGQALAVRVHPTGGLEVLFSLSERSRSLVTAVKDMVPAKEFGWKAENAWYPCKLFDLFDWMEEFDHDF
jgi:hypothetical protein